MRFPNASAKELTFVARGTLWTVPLKGGLARELVRDPGEVLMPRFSPDGRWIAYTARRQGGQDVYVIPSGGGSEKRLTFDAAPGNQGNMVLTWTPDSQNVVFLSQHAAWASKVYQAYMAPLAGGIATSLPLDSSGLLSFGPDANTIVYNRVFRNFDTRKRYVGGQAQDLYTYNFVSKALVRLTDWKGTNTSPMWFGNTIYFLSDRDPSFRLNLWALDLASKKLRQITHFNDFDIDFPSIGTDMITFQQGGKLYSLALPSETLSEVHVEVPDDGTRTAPRKLDADSYIRTTDIAHGIDYALSPHGTDVLLSARGDLFRVSATQVASSVNLTQTSQVDEDHPAWSPDGDTIAYVTDASGEEQIATRPTSGGSERQLTHFGHGYLYMPLWSPSGTSIAVADGNHDLWLVDAANGKETLVTKDPYAEIHDAAFSPYGKWLAFSTVLPNQMRSIHLYEIASAKNTLISSPMNSDRLPAFSADGNLLYFVSQRHEQPILSDRDQETNIASLKSDGIYVVPLTDRKDTQAGFGSLTAQASSLSVTAANISKIELRGAQIFFQEEPEATLSGELAGEQSALHAFDLASRKDTVLVKAVDDFCISLDGSRLLYRMNGGWQLMATVSGGPSSEVSVRDLPLTLYPKREWAEMFDKAWRLDRDMFWSKDMYGTNWEAIHTAYAKFLPLLGSHADFMYLLGQLQGELATSHTFIGGGDSGDDRPQLAAALLGADYMLDSASGRYRFARIYSGDNSRERFRSPLTAPGVELAEGDYLLAINGKELKAPESPPERLLGLEGDVSLTISRTANGARRNVVVSPLKSETDLRNQDWVEHNREVVDSSSRGKLGYMYLSDFYQAGSEDFLRQFYPQINKEGLIIDIRWNGGGFTSQWVLGILRRQLVGQFVNREDATTTLPGAVMTGPMVTLTNYFSASDGDQFPYYFRKYGLGKVIGTRTWGGVRGIKGPWRLMDGTYVLIPKDSLYSTDSKWILENYGDEPDLTVESLPDEILTLRDVQLQTAVRVLLTDLDQQPSRIIKPPPSIPAYPKQGDVPPASTPKPQQN